MEKIQNYINGDLVLPQSGNYFNNVSPVTGEVYSLMAMISVIKHAEIPVATIVEGKAMSCGAILFSFGEEGKRFMCPHATLMIHDVSSMDRG